jgi:predicted S18 family serine protease
MIKRIRIEVARSLMVMMLGTVLLAIAGQASAQNSAPPAAQPPPAQVQTTQRSTTTTTQTERAVEGANPLWFILGGIALLAIILIAILASRGRGDGHTHVRESTTVVKKE